MPTETFSLIEPALAEAGIRIDAERRERLERFAGLVLHWNRAMNLIGDPERFYSRHLLDCLMLETLPGLQGARRVLDIGSGAGLPGIVLALMHPEWRVVLAETVQKKVTFLRVAAQALGLDGGLGVGNLLPRRENVHEMAAGEDGGAYDVVVARAFAEMKVLLPLAAGLLRPGGQLWAMKGARLAEEQAALSAGELAPFEPEPGLYPYDFAGSGIAGVGGVIAVYRKLAGASGGA